MCLDSGYFPLIYAFNVIYLEDNFKESLMDKILTEEIFRADAYVRDCSAIVMKITERGGIILDRTVFYPTGGGQPGDCGHMDWDEKNIQIATTVKDRDTGEIIHVPEEGDALPEVGSAVTLSLDWDRRYLHMRMHSALHLLCAVVPCGVTGGQIGDKKSRLDFDVGETRLEKQQITEVLNRLVLEDHKLSSRWITDRELDENAELVRTMSVSPPRGSGRVRLIKVGDAVDLQPCGGTHVKHTAEIGAIKVSKIENKGKRNRRVNIVFDV